MSSQRWCVLLCAAVTAGGAGGCALLSKSAPITPRYYSPERPGDVPRPAARRPGPPAELRLGRIDSAANLDELLVFRDSSREVGYYRLRRWTEAPEQYLRRRLARVLFEERGLGEVVGGGGPTLDVQLTAFEEIRGAPRRARVQVIVRLHDDRLVRWEQTVTVEQPVVRAKGGDPAEAAVEAIGGALRAAVDRIADRVVRELAVT
ncbi:MAG TPA: ABC-type transport auxiliary lipoprotein family protein, partial [Polyangia bacterium]